MAKIVFTKEAFADFERVFDFYAPDDPALARAQVVAIRDAIKILGHHPLIGRLVKQGLRELVISIGKTGFLALYRYIPRRGQVSILRIRHQRELDYPQL
ncbi:MAG: type II toxin-antitoxin system RelE/ParE family toxin [Deltaproteobacteria bacterium]|nr:type II toxin-antitoxin system RelE/ParE family toxin [Deltaproteobacteria bacterium]MDQ3296649.1 type II toxin-antitoxin system RelE/ParE family toxin [Myxococcota bacterium]